MKTKKIFIVIIIINLLLQQNIKVFAKNNLEQQQTSIDDKIEEARQQQQEIKKSKSETMNVVEGLIEDISLAQSEIDELQRKIVSLQEQINLKENDIQQKEEEYVKQNKLLDTRLIAIYENGRTSYLEVLLTASSVSDFLAKYYAASELIAYDKELISYTKQQKGRIENEKAEIENNKKEINEVLEEQEKKVSQLESLKKEKERKVEKLTEEEKEIQKELEKFESDKREIEAELRKIAEKEAKKASYNNVDANPSTYGYISPILGTSQKNITCGYYGYKNHGGVDFGGHYGETIVAVKAGTVEISRATTGSIKNYNFKGEYLGSYSSYGEYIVINHHDGTMTLYAHGLAGSRLVKAGDKVKQGQKIMTVGNTGNVMSGGKRPSKSNPLLGAHLHFEVRLKGTRVNPTQYLP